MPSFFGYTGSSSNSSLLPTTMSTVEHELLWGASNSGSTTSDERPQREKYLQRMKILQTIREKAAGRLNLPQICVVGDQSSGKSALLGACTNITFPVSAGICTRAPIVVQSEYAAGANGTSYAILEDGMMWQNCESLTELGARISTIQKKAIDGLAERTPSAHEAVVADVAGPAGSGDADAGVVDVSEQSGSCRSISSEEIRVRVRGPDQMDIIIIDLPGIIHNGDGASETRALIKKYCEPRQTLTLLVSEAKQDLESITALDLTKRWDPQYKRTLRVLTKFDVFDSEQARARAEQWVQNDEAKPLGCHAVVCRVGGQEEYVGHDRETELLSGLPTTRAGVASLRGRLPAQFCQLIATNLPDLRRQIQTNLQDATDRIRAIGEEPIEGLLMIRELQQCVEAREDFEQRLTPDLRAFQTAIKDTEQQLTKEWTDSKFEPNAFRISIFQGDNALMKCMEEIANDWWAKPLDEYISKMDEESHASLNLQLLRKGSRRFKEAVHSEWARFCDETLLAEFRLRCMTSLKQEEGFGTINHYLDAKYKEGRVMPEELKTELSQNLESKIAGFRAAYTAELATYQANLRAGRTGVPPASVEARIREYLEQETRIWVDRYEKKDLFEQQKERLHEAAHALFTVEHKTFVDVVQKQTRDFVVRERDQWMQHEVVFNETLRNNAKEDEERAAEREKLVERKEAMLACLRELDQVMDA